MKKEKEVITYRDGSVFMFKRNNSNVWQTRIKLSTGKWKELSTKSRDYDEAVETAKKLHDELQFKVKHNVPITNRKFKDVAKITLRDLKSDIAAGVKARTFQTYVESYDRKLCSGVR